MRSGLQEGFGAVPRRDLLRSVSQLGDAGDLVGRDYEALVVGPDPELGAFPDVLVPGSATRGGIMDPDVEHEHPPLVLAVVAAHIGQRARGLDHNRDPVQLGVSRVKNVARHG